MYKISCWNGWKKKRSLQSVIGNVVYKKNLIRLTFMEYTTGSHQGKDNEVVFTT